jgi:hypothetical protein
MDLWILTEDFQRVGIVDTATSIIWTNRHRQHGDFEIYISASAAVLDLLQEDRFVVRDDDDMVGIIEHVELNTDEENGDFLTVTGPCTRSILARRIVWEQTAINDTVENGMRQLVTDAFISPKIAERKYAGLTLAAAHGYSDRIQTQYTGDNIKETVEGLCAANNYGYKMPLVGGVLQLDFYKGTDRSTRQSKNPCVVFSEEYDNLTATTYTRDKTAYKSVALVAGEGEGTARRCTTVSRSTDTSGLHRRELFVDARDVSSNDGEIADEEYMAQLAERGATALSEAPIVESMAGTVEPLQMYTYKKDYFLGDIVTVVNKYGIAVDAQVLEIVETWDEDGYTCTPTFG